MYRVTITDLQPNTYLCFGGDNLFACGKKNLDQAAVLQTEKCPHCCEFASTRLESGDYIIVSRSLLCVMTCGMFHLGKHHYDIKCVIPLCK